MKIIKHKIIIPIKLALIKRKQKKLNKLFEGCSDNMKLLTNTTFQKRLGTEKLKEQVFKTMELNQKLLNENVKLTAKIFKLKQELKNG